MAKNIENKEKKQEENVGEALSSASLWFEEHQKLVYSIIIGILVVIFGIYAYMTWVVKPAKEEAQVENGLAETYYLQACYFEQQQDSVMADSLFNLALNGAEGKCIGFLENAESNYQENKLAALYAGTIFYKQGKYADAAEYLEKFSSGEDQIEPASKMLLGDTYVELDQLDDAVKAYKSAIGSENLQIAPMAIMKLAFVYMEQQNNEAAIEVLQQLVDDYSQSQQVEEAKKYIAYLQ